MQTNNNPYKDRTNIPSKSYINNSTTTQETPQKRSELADLFKPPADPFEAEIERAKLYGRQPPNSLKSSTFTA